MGNEQQSGTIYHSLMDTSNNKKHQQQTESSAWIKSELISLKKPSWEIARDISMEMLSRKASRLSQRQGRNDEFFF